MDLKKKYGEWALVTGATSGIGAELTKHLAAQGMNIVLVARKEKELNDTAIALTEQYGVKTICISADLATEDGIAAVKKVTEPIGLLVLAAGLEVNGAYEKTNLESELKVIQINVVSTFQLTHHFSRQMLDRKKGGILMIASLSGHMPNPYLSNYAGTKAYVLNLGASLYGELTPKGIDVSVLSPGLTNTPMIQANGIDWKKTPMQAMNPEIVAKEAIHGLGKKLVIIPGKQNQLMAWISKHSPLKMQAKMNQKMMFKAMDKTKV